MLALELHNFTSLREIEREAASSTKVWKGAVGRDEERRAERSINTLRRQYL